MSDEVLVAKVEVVDDRTASSRCDEGFLRVRRFVLRNTFTDGTVSEPYPCDVLSRRRVDAVAVVLWHREPDGGAPEQARAGLAGQTPSSPPDAPSSREAGERLRRTHPTDGGRIFVHYREGTRPPIWLRRHKTAELPMADRRSYDRLGEIVAGVLEEDDKGLEGVRRRGAIEAKEEAGYDVDMTKVHALGDDGFFPSPGVTDEKVYLIAAEIDPGAKGHAAGDGSIQEQGTRMVTRELRDAIRACRSGEVADAKTELALLRLADHLGYVPQLDCWLADLPPGLRERYDRLGVGAAPAR